VKPAKSKNATGNFVCTLAVDASNDVNPANDTAQLRLNIVPFFDAALDAPGSALGLLNDVVEGPFTATTLNQAMSNPTGGAGDGGGGSPSLFLLLGLFLAQFVAVSRRFPA